MGVNENNETNGVMSELELYQNVFEKIEPNLVISSFEVSFWTFQTSCYLINQKSSGFWTFDKLNKTGRFRIICICTLSNRVFTKFETRAHVSH